MNNREKRQEFIQNNIRQKYGDSKGKQTLTSDEMSKFYKSFLDEHLDMHREYNKEWYKRNMFLNFVRIFSNVLMFILK
ncbi:Apoptogenic protein 1, mitochondrial [Portunus trituberculatus]|uniref:Apoptogenic protein 1, mitochondrial n=1 Tax=Portunus trituberculatus TaxID=210409 RepID=A0A5B7DBJ8_PORTR|nr:Apoptogenic protein 1, mitochondrial [Portunus trituberculatus]